MPPRSSKPDKWHPVLAFMFNVWIAIGCWALLIAGGQAVIRLIVGHAA